MINEVVAVFDTGKYARTKPLTRLDYGQKLRFVGLELPASYEVDFSTDPTRSGLSKTVIGGPDGVLIPQEYLKPGLNVYAYVYVVQGESGRTWCRAEIPMDDRPERTAETPAPEQQSLIEQAIAALNTGVERAEAAAQEAADSIDQARRVTSLDDTPLASTAVIEAVGAPVYVSDVSAYADYGITSKGWYVFARIAAQAGVTVGEGAAVTGAAGAIITQGADHVDVAVKFDVAALSQAVTVTWAEGNTERFVFKATDLAVRNLDYRVTFFVYDAAPYVRFEYARTTDTAFVANKRYYTKDGDTYTLAEVTTGAAVTANTYYNHSKVIIEGLVRNITYKLDEPIDCPMEFILPDIEDETHGCWFEIRCHHLGEYSMTLTPPSSDIKVATEHTQKEAAGINMIQLHYTYVDGVKLWRFLNTKSTIPT